MSLIFIDSSNPEKRWIEAHPMNVKMMPRIMSHSCVSKSKISQSQYQVLVLGKITAEQFGVTIANG